MSRARLLAIVLVSTLATATLGWLARAPYDPPGGDTGLLRLSWRLRGEKAETCRPRTQAELDALPVHMRTPEVCEGRLLAYTLVVQVDDSKPDSTRVLPGGARGDRPVFVLRELPLPPGNHRIRVRFELENSGSDRDGDDQSLADALAIETTVASLPGAIDLITLSPDAKRFVHVPSAPR